MTPIEALGLELDTDRHEAVARFAAGEEQKGRIVDVILAWRDATQAREMTLFLMYWQISRPMPDLPGGGATLFLAGEDHAYYEKAK